MFKYCTLHFTCAVQSEIKITGCEVFVDPYQEAEQKVVCCVVSRVH